MKIIETPIFTKAITKLMDDDDYRKMQQALVCCPLVGDQIKHSGGLRKIRWKSGGKGKRGGSRIIYYWYKNEEIIYMLYAYQKNR